MNITLFNSLSTPGFQIVLRNLKKTTIYFNSDSNFLITQSKISNKNCLLFSKKKKSCNKISDLL